MSDVFAWQIFDRGVGSQGSRIESAKRGGSQKRQVSKDVGLEWFGKHSRQRLIWKEAG